MSQVLVLYPNPPDIKAFERHYFDVHLKLATKIPGLTRFEVSRGVINSPAGPSPYHLIAQLNFNTIDDLRAGLASEQSKVATEDLVNFAPEGRRVFLFDTQIIL